MEDYEAALKQVMYLARRAGETATYVQSLEEKLRYQRMRTELHKAIKILRLHYYDINDMLKINVPHCTECGTVIPEVCENM